MKKMYVLSIRRIKDNKFPEEKLLCIVNERTKQIISERLHAIGERNDFCFIDLPYLESQDQAQDIENES